MTFLKSMKLSATKLLSRQPSASTPFAKSIKRFLRFLLIVPPLMLSVSCSKAVSVTPMPRPPGNLASKCLALQTPPLVLLDPERALWEADIIAKYADCSMKHRMTVKAWEDAVAVK